MLYTYRERMLRIPGSRPTIYPFLADKSLTNPSPVSMSFVGDSVSRYYSAVPGSMPALRELVRALPSALVGYSGGVDSALLAVVLRQELGRERLLAVVGRSASYPPSQWAAARAVAAQFDVPLLQLVTHHVQDPDYLANPPNHCLLCLPQPCP